MNIFTHYTREATLWRSLLAVLCVVLFSVLLTSCSTKHNTPATRFWHSFNAHYNAMYNGELAYKEGEEAQYKGHQDDYTKLLPMYVSTNKTTAGLGKSNYETAITKCEKAIKLHSIKKKPTVKASHKLTPKEKEYRARKEFTPYLKHSWLMLAKSQFNQGDFIEAASTFNYIIRLYSTQPEVYSVAKAYLARCYVALGWSYDAEDVLNKIRRDSITSKGEWERDNTLAAFYIATERYVEAIPYLQKTIKHTKSKIQHTRLNYLMGQLYHETGDDATAYKYLNKVVKSNPPYELEFNARIMQAEVMPKSKYKQMISKLKRMAKNDKNKDYLDRVYFAIGNIHLNNQDTTRCCYAWEAGAEKSTKNGIAKAVLLLRLGQLYWEKEKYIEAQKAYQSCISILDKEHEEYKESEHRSKILDELAAPLGDIKLQDSLQALAKMPEKDYMAAIDRVIEELKKKEKEEAKKAAKQEANISNNNTAQTTTNNIAAAGPQQKGAWYFYNPQTIQTGKQTFQRKWGKRQNEDNWRRSNKEATSSEDFEQYDYSENDSLQNDFSEEDFNEENQKLQDSLANDPHNREFYLKQIPFTEEQLAVSNATLSEGLYKAGVIEAEKLDNFYLARRTLERLLRDFPDFEKKDDIYYHMFLLMGRMGNIEEAERYRQLLINEFPESASAILLANPNYEMIAREGRHMEDSLYMDAYQAYLENRYEVVELNYKFSTENFPNGANRAKLCFVHAMTQLYTGNQKDFMSEMKEVVDKYSKDEISEMASYIVKGLQEGRLLSNDKYNASDIWGRRSSMLLGDSTAMADTLSMDRYSNFNFVLAYPTGCLNDNQLLFELARYNFSSYMVRNFEIAQEKMEGISMMIVKGFLSYDEAHAYAQQLLSDRRMVRRLDGLKTLIISDKNLSLLGKQYSFDDYSRFFEEKFAPLQIPKNVNLDEQIDQPFIDPDEIEERQDDGSVEELIEGDEDDFPFGF